MKRILREPLLHFVILGALLFAAFAVLNPGGGAENKIVVSAAQIDNLAQQFQRTWQRAPAQDELEGLIDNHIREEVLYREGVALGLDQDDQIVRRRVQQKVQFMVEDAAGSEPEDAQLQAYFAANGSKFASESRVTFVQVYVNPAAHSNADARAQTLLARLRGGDAKSAESGDPSLLPAEFGNVREGEVIRTFGEEFAGALAQLETGAWQGPVRSAYGLHLVRLDARTEAAVPPFDQVREAVAREFLREQQVQASERMYTELRAQYTITIEPAPASSAAASP